MTRLIDADALKKAFKKSPFVNEVHLYYARLLINNAPTIEERPITIESAIDYLTKIGWLKEHDKELTQARPHGELYEFLKRFPNLT